MSYTNESIATSTHQAADAPAKAGGRNATRRSLSEILEAYALLILLVAVAVFFSVYGPTSDTFATTANLRSILANQAVVAIIALAALIPLVCHGWDLSLGAIAGVSSVFVASAVGSGMPVGLAVLMGVGLGTLVGGINALLIVRGRVNAVITTLGMWTLLEGVINQKTGGLAIVDDIPESMFSFGTGTTLGIPRPAYVLAFVAIGVYFMLQHTPVGRYLYALGSNASAAVLVGLRTRLLVATAFVTAGALAGLAGVVQVARAGGADPRVGVSFTLPALAAAFLSAAAIKPGRYNVGGTLVAIFFLATVNSGLNLAGAESYVSSYVNGAALIIGVGLGAYLGRKRTGGAA